MLRLQLREKKKRKKKKRKRYEIKFSSGFSLRTLEELERLGHSSATPRLFLGVRIGIFPKELGWNRIHLCPQ